MGVMFCDQALIADLYVVKIRILKDIIGNLQD
jgi:hypothetical protein